MCLRSLIYLSAILSSFSFAGEELVYCEPSYKLFGCDRFHQVEGYTTKNGNTPVMHVTVPSDEYGYTTLPYALDDKTYKAANSINCLDGFVTMKNVELVSYTDYYGNYGSLIKSDQISCRVTPVSQ